MTFPDDVTHLDEPHTYREMFQRIMWLMEKDREDRAEDREMLEGFINNQNTLNDKMSERLSAVETCVKVQNEAIDTLKKQSRTIDAVIGIVAGVAAALAAFIKGN